MQSITRNSLLIICLLFSINTQAATWLLRIDNHSLINSSISGEIIYRFSNGDNLYSLQDEQLSQIELDELFNTSGFRYLQADLTLAEQEPIIQERAIAQSETPQDFLQQDGFKGLANWQRDCSNVNIAIIDSGVDMTHPQLQHINFTTPLDARLDDTTVTDEYGHGTHVSGLIAAQTGTDNNAEGACTNATLIPIRFLDRYGAGSVSDAIKGVRWAIDNNAQVINHSWTVRSYSQALFDVIEEADQLGIVQVAAAGNLGTNIEVSPVYPAAFSTQLSGLITVANWDNEQQALYQSSSFGMTSVDLAASGTNVLSLAPDNSSEIRTGTSMSAPLVSATVAMLKQQNTSLNSAQIRSILQLSSKPEVELIHQVQSNGRLNATAALEQETNTTNLLFAEIKDNQINLHGVGFLDSDQWKFTSVAIPAQIFELTKKSSSDQTVSFDNQELTNGYWQLYRDNQLISTLAYQPTLVQPTELQAISNEMGLLLSWRGSEFSQSYQIQASIDEQSYITIGELSAPANQLQHKISNYSTIRYRIRASYDYQFDGHEVFSKQSLYSDSLLVSTDSLIDNGNLSWQSELIASVPQGSEALIPLQLTNNNLGGFFELLDDPDNLVLNLSSEGQLQINTSQVLSSVITIAYNYNDAQTIKQLTLSINEDTHWTLNINNEEKISLIASGFSIHSWQRLIDGTYQINGTVTDTQALLSLSLDSVSRKLETVNVYDSGTSLSADKLIIDNQQVNINLPVVNLDAKELLVDLTLSNKNESSDSRCFIASSIYPNQPEKLIKLRKFRDQVLLKVPGGKSIVSTYYYYSPTLVEKLKNNPRTMNALRTSLDLFL